MAQIIGLPKLSPTMEEGVLVRWTKKEGDKVSPGDLVAEVETDKANMDFNIEDEGVLLKILVKEGDTVKLGAPVAIIGDAGEDVTALIAQASGGAAPKADAKPAPKADAKPAPKADAKPAPKADAKPAPKADAAPAPKADAAPAKRPAGATEQGAEDSANAPAAQLGESSAEEKGADPKVGQAHAKTAAAAATTTAAAAAKSSTAGPAAGRVLASPLAKTLAIELGIDLRQVTGTGPGGRIVERDVRALQDGDAAPPAAVEAAPTDAADADADAISDATSDGDDGADAAADADAPKTALAVRSTRPPAALDADYEDVPASNMRKRIAARLTEAKRDVPHFYLQRQIDAAPLLAFRARLNDLLGDRGKVSVNDLVIKAVALALRRMPDANAAWVGEAIRHFHRVHIGVAVAIEDGLVTPVVRDADQKGIGAIAAEVRDLAERAKTRKLKSHEITGSTFTVSNLGMLGIERFTAILNPPEAGILAIGAVQDAAVVKDGQVVAGKRMTVSMSCDHRVIDGALGARWLQVFAELIEKPESLAL